MADPADLAAKEIAALQNMALAYRKPTGPRPIGECHECGDDQIADGALHCGDTECERRFNLHYRGKS